MSNKMLLAPKVPIRVPNTITIISRARRVQIPSCDLYIDVSFMMSEFEWAMNGQEPFIKNTLYSLYESFYKSLAETISYLKVESGLVIVVVCEHGQHRSVASAEILCTELQSLKWAVRVKHEELEKWFKF